MDNKNNLVYRSLDFHFWWLNRFSKGFKFLANLYSNQRNRFRDSNIFDGLQRNRAFQSQKLFFRVGNKPTIMIIMPIKIPKPVYPTTTKKAQNAKPPVSVMTILIPSLAILPTTDTTQPQALRTFHISGIKLGNLLATFKRYSPFFCKQAKFHKSGAYQNKRLPNRSIFLKASPQTSPIFKSPFSNYFLAEADSRGFIATGY